MVAIQGCMKDGLVLHPTSLIELVWLASTPTLNNSRRSGQLQTNKFFAFLVKNDLVDHFRSRFSFKEYTRFLLDVLFRPEVTENQKRSAWNSFHLLSLIYKSEVVEWINGVLDPELYASQEQYQSFFDMLKQSEIRTWLDTNKTFLE